MQKLKNIFNLNRFNISLVLLIIPLLQSCYMYKTVSSEEMKFRRYYRVQIDDGREITTKYLDKTSDSLIFKARNRRLHVSKKAITTIERRRHSPAIYIAAIAFPAYLIIDVLTNDKPSLQEVLTDRVTQ